MRLASAGSPAAAPLPRVAARAAPAAAVNLALRPSIPLTPRGGSLSAVAEGGVLTTSPVAPPIAATTPSTAGRVSVARAAPSPDIELPLVPTVERTPRSRATALEHLATAVILSERALVRAKDRANKTWLALTTRNVKSLVSFAHGLILVVPALVPTKHWATIILIAQWLGPTVSPTILRLFQEVTAVTADKLKRTVHAGIGAIAGRLTRALTAATCRLLMVLQTRLTHGATVTVPSPSPGSLHMIADIASTDMSELLSDMQGVNAGM